MARATVTKARAKPAAAATGATHSGRPVWSGTITFGLVTIPVKLHTAIREKRIAFRSLHDQDQVPLKQKLVCPRDGKEVHPEHIVKGYEIEKDRFVIVRQEELEAAAPKSSKAIEIQDFVDLVQIDPLFFDKPYHVVPTPQGARPYKLLLDAMRETGKVGIAKVVLFGKEHLAALRVSGEGMGLETMHFGDEIVPPPAAAETGRQAKVDDRELKVAIQLIGSLATEFDATRYRDEYRERVMEMIERKAAGEDVVDRPETDPAPARDGGGAGLVAALEASLLNAKARAGTNGNGHSGNGHHSDAGNGRASIASARNGRAPRAHPRARVAARRKSA